MFTDGTGRDERDLWLSSIHLLPLSGLFVERVRSYSSSCCKPNLIRFFIPLHFPSNLVILTPPGIHFQSFFIRSKACSGRPSNSPVLALVGFSSNYTIFTILIHPSSPVQKLLSTQFDSFSTQPRRGGAIWDIYLRGPALYYRERGEGRTSFGSSGVSSHW